MFWEFNYVNNEQPDFTIMGSCKGVITQGYLGLFASVNLALN